MDVLYIYNSLTFNKIKCSINKKWRYLNYSYSPEYEKKIIMYGFIRDK